MKCQNCGKEINSEMRFCANCGAPVNAVTNEKKCVNDSVSDNESMVRSNFFEKNKYLILLMIIAVAVVGGIIVKFIASRSMNNADDSAYEYEEMAGNDVDEQDVKAKNDDAVYLDDQENYEEEEY